MRDKASNDAGEIETDARRIMGGYSPDAVIQEETCNGLGWIECYCGGDNCVCEWNGEIPCGGCSECEPDGYEQDYGD